LGKSRVVLDVHSSFPNQLGSATGGKQSDSMLGQSFGQIEQSGLVVDGQNRYGDDVSLVKIQIAG
jgi:hypothetical protein